MIWKKISETSMEKCPRCQGDECLAIEYAKTKRGSVFFIFCLNPKVIDEGYDDIHFAGQYSKLTKKQKERIKDIINMNYYPHCLSIFNKEEQEQLMEAKKNDNEMINSGMIASTLIKIKDKRIFEIIKEKWKRVCSD